MNDKVNLSAPVTTAGGLVSRMPSDENALITYKSCDSLFLIMFLGENALIDHIMQGHPTSKLSKRPLKDISRLLVIYKDCLKRCFYHLDKFDLFGYLS